ncbi:MAG: hypothetical protein M1818_004450 [Claussenomyces sp. TS43310]|nr:MAG: hypothetical protein M1818_004450 [Claussenomyces sp. TS43310]
MSTPKPGAPSLADRFKGLTRDAYNARWDDLWSEGATSWDRGAPSPALVDLLRSDPRCCDTHSRLGPSDVVVSGDRSDKRPKRALVPGCGRGYDVLALAAAGYDVYGLEISQNALLAAREHERLHGQDRIYRPRMDPFTEEPMNREGKVTWLSGDFFLDDFLKDFLSALPVSMRAAWSKRYSELLEPTGRVICLEWPSVKPAKTGGPPWSLPPKVYLSHLPRPGQELPYDEDDLLENELGPEPDDGLECIWRIQPTKTHAAGVGKDGKVTDWLSIWRHKVVA